MIHKPTWYKDNFVVVSNAPTCGINKDGQDQFIINELTGERTREIDDKLSQDIQFLNEGKSTAGYLSEIPFESVKEKGIYVPAYYNTKLSNILKHDLSRLKGFKAITLGELFEKKVVRIFHGHGSPSSDQRIGEIPYIKVSDIRAGHININPSNLIPKPLAEKYWKGLTSNLRPYDLISPERASKNIGEFSVLMPGQEEIVLTKEVIVIRSLKEDFIDQFFLMWALSLDSVKRQWKRIVFMQTNREDVGERFLEVKIPISNDPRDNWNTSDGFRKYYMKLEKLRSEFKKHINNSELKHHFKL